MSEILIRNWVLLSGRPDLVNPLKGLMEKASKKDQRLLLELQRCLLAKEQEQSKLKLDLRKAKREVSRLSEQVKVLSKGGFNA